MAANLSAFPIIKVSAAGNDFLLIDLTEAKLLKIWQKDFAQIPRADLAKKWCDRHESLGADGLVILEKDPELDFAWDFYNSDGGSAEMCGNAARAVTLYMHATYGKSQFKFRSRVGTVQAKFTTADKIEVVLPAVKESAMNQLVEVRGQKIHFDFVRAGVPHAAIKVPSISDRAGLRELALTIKGEPRFQKEGINVTFIHSVGAQKLESVTFERGVEDFTLACGTGAIAAAFVITHGEENREIEVQVPGGRLFVVWKNGHPHLRGPAKIVGEMRVNTEA